jgi:nuclear pore complex protein Nup155
LPDRVSALVSDPTRDCFYTLSRRNSISVYRPAGEKSIDHIQTISNLYKAAQEKAPGAPALTPQNFVIIGLHVIYPSESRSGVQLVAYTVNGVRLYFSPSAVTTFNPYGRSDSSGSIRPLHLTHVRLPPSNLLHPDEQTQPQSEVGPYGNMQPVPPPPRPYITLLLDCCCYSEGLSICAQPGDTDGYDFILCMSPDLTRIGTLGQTGPQQQHQQHPQQAHVLVQQQAAHPVYPGNPSNSAAIGPLRPPLTEYASLLSIAGRTWAIAAVPGLTPPAVPPTSPVPTITNELATQFSAPAKQFMILTNSGLSFLAKRRPMDYLRAVIEEVQSEGNVQPIIDFRDR